MKYVFASLLLAIFTTGSFGADPLVWPQFRGPNGSGIAEGQKPPVEFGPNKNLKWKVAIPGGFSSPIIAGDNLVLTAFDSGKLFTIAYQRQTGKEAWRAEANAKQIERFHKTEGSPAASSPATDGKRIVSYFGSCGLLCYDLAGKELWRYEMPTAVTQFDFGTGVSPLIVDGLVILLRDESKNPKIIAVDLATGKLVWETKRESKSSFSTPVICETPNGKQVVAPGHKRMIGYDVKTGKEQWTVVGMPAVPCTLPVVENGVLYFGGWSPGDDFKLPTFDELLKETGEVKQGYITEAGLDKTMMKGMFSNQDTNHDGKLTRDEWDEGLKMLSFAKNSVFAVRLGSTGDITGQIIWKQTKGLPYVPSGILYHGQFIMVKDGGLLTTIDSKTGKELYVQDRAVASGRYYASPVAANGFIYFTCLDNGAVTVLKAGTEEPEVVAKNPKLNERVAATPALADDTIYIRGEKNLYAFSLKK